MTVQPEFCKSNYMDLNANPTFEISLLPAGNWYEEDVNLLYNHKSDKKLFTTGMNDDTKTAYVTLDMQDDFFITAVKLLKTNARTGLVEISYDNSSWTTLYSFTDNEQSSIHCYNSTYFNGYDYIQAEDGQVITTESGLPLEPETPNLGRYIRISIDTTIIPNEEKFIGELYIGQRVIKLETGKILNYAESRPDPTRSFFRDYNGTPSTNLRKIQYESSFSVLRPSTSEANFLKDLELLGGVYDFFPVPDSGSDIDDTVSIDDVYLITATATYNRNIYGRNVSGITTINLMETKIVV